MRQPSEGRNSNLILFKARIRHIFQFLPCWYLDWQFIGTHLIFYVTKRPPDKIKI
jgi:hypothetical protein